MVGIRAFGLSLGERVLPLTELAAQQHTTVEAVATVLGHASVHCATAPEGATVAEARDETVRLSLRATHQCLERAGVGPLDLDAILWCSGVASGHLLTSLRFQEELGATRAFCQVAGVSCADLVTGLMDAQHMLEHDANLRRILVVSGEVWAEERTALSPLHELSLPLVSDGASALLVERDAPHALLGFGCASSGKHWDYYGNELRARKAEEPQPAREKVSPLEFVHDAVAVHQKALSRCLTDAQRTIADVDHLVTLREKPLFATSFARHIGLTTDKLVPVDEGPSHVGAADPAFGLDTLARSGKAKPGHHVLLCGRTYWITQFCMLKWGAT